MNDNNVLCILGLMILMMFTSCGGTVDNSRNLDREIKSALKNSPGIDISEWKKINELISSDNNLLQELPTEEKLEVHIRSIAQEMNESGRSTIELPINIEKEGASQRISIKQKRKYNIYLENSGSMYGYLGGNTAFKDALMDLCSRFSRKQESINFFFVNDQIHPIQGELEDFMNYLKPEKLRRIGNVGSSNVGDILDMVLDSVVHNEESAILTSDFIFSLKNAKNIENQLTTQKYGITNIIVKHRLREEKYGFLIIQGQSLFDGYYYDFKNNSSRISIDRPYYTWIIAPLDKILNFANDYDIKSLKGYQNHTLIFDSEYLPIPYFTILPESEKIGEFRKKDRKKNVIKEITSISYDHRKDRVFQFSIAIDFSKIPATDKYLLNPKNYTLKSSQGDEFALNVIPLNEAEINKRDEKFLQGATHLLKISSSTISTGDQKLIIALRKTLPEWLKSASTLDDGDIKGTAANQTFGLEYLVEGIVDAFSSVEEAEEFYFKVPINLNR